MSYISTLEERIGDVFFRIQNLNICDQDSLDEVEHLLEYLKVDAERFQSLSNHTQHVLDTFNSLKNNINVAEQLVAEKKRIVI